MIIKALGIKSFSDSGEILAVAFPIIDFDGQKIDSVNIEDIIADLKKASVPLNSKKLSLANEDYLMNILGIKPGSVSPFGLLNDKEKKVK